ncbi:CatB-related O-acetyltransferase [Nibricoccus sp. IMCC34717]|uniref:CatB-related O-acetyltransferase n=1 Tax=Nibricoccus sp. IMCC34717 TaxID=3034021 RepID=UPI00384F3BB8
MMHSVTLRAILKQYENVTVGMYSYGDCLLPGKLPTATKIGSYCSFAASVRVFRRNHPVDRASQHPIFYNSKLGQVSQDTIGSIADNPLTIGNDVWIGFGAMVLPGCSFIGNGCIIAAGAVVTKNLPEYGVYAGNPARKVKDRFSSRAVDVLSSSQWWTRTPEELAVIFPLFQKSLGEQEAEEIRHQLLDSGQNQK